VRPQVRMTALSRRDTSGAAHVPPTPIRLMPPNSRTHRRVQAGTGPAKHARPQLTGKTSQCGHRSEWQPCKAQAANNPRGVDVWCLFFSDDFAERGVSPL